MPASTGRPMEVVQAPDTAHAEHLEQARRVLALPVEASRLHWHPFGVFTIPMAKRRDGDRTWSRRLHIWHPAGVPVGPASAYGVHTHSGPANSHVLVGSLFHHLYAFAPASDGIWLRCPGDDRWDLVAHAKETTEAGTTHSLPKDHPHGVSKRDGWAISLFEQLDGPTDMPFTTWRRTDVPEEPLVRQGPEPADAVRRDALMAIDRALSGL